HTITPRDSETPARIILPPRAEPLPGTLRPDALGQHNSLTDKEFRPLSRCPTPRALDCTPIVRQQNPDSLWETLLSSAPLRSTAGSGSPRFRPGCCSPGPSAGVDDCTPPRGSVRSPGGPALGHDSCGRPLPPS